MLKHLNPILVAVAFAVAPCAWAAPQEAPQKPAQQASGETPKKRPGLFSFLKRDKKKPVGEPAAQAAPLPGASEQRRKTFVTVKDGIPFYEWGPIQAGGADRVLQKGVLVTLLKDGGGWPEVRLEDGTTGVVSREEIRKAKASDLPVRVVKKVPEPAAPKPVALSERVPAPPLPELEGFDLDTLEEGRSPIDISENPLLFPAVLQESLKDTATR